MKKGLFLLAIFVLTISAFGVSAIPNATSAEAANATQGVTGSITTTAAVGGVVTQGRNVTHINITRNASTLKWAGFFGQTFGSLRLGLNADVFFSFSSVTPQSVYASQNSNFPFGNISATTTTEVNIAFGFNDSDANDRAQNAFTDTATVGNIASVPVAILRNNANAIIFYPGIFDTTNNASQSLFAFGVNVNADVTDFRGGTSDYELLVPVALTGTGGAGTATYFFYMDLQ